MVNPNSQVFHVPPPAGPRPMPPPGPPVISNPAPGVWITPASRYRIRGRISPADNAGKQYDVDLVVESLP